VLVQVLLPGPMPVSRSICQVHCGKTADWIWMAFGMVGWLGPKMRHVIRVGDYPMGRGSFAVDVGHSCVTSEDFVA